MPLTTLWISRHFLAVAQDVSSRGHDQGFNYTLEIGREAAHANLALDDERLAFVLSDFDHHHLSMATTSLARALAERLVAAGVRVAYLELQRGDGLRVFYRQPDLTAATGCGAPTVLG